MANRILLVFTIVLASCMTEPQPEPEPDFALSMPEKIITDCRAFEQSSLYQPRASQLTISANENWQQQLEAVGENTEVLLEDGVYHLTQHSLYLKRNVTVRSASGNRGQVQILGSGYQVRSEGFAVFGDNVSIADLTISNLRDHGVAIMDGSDRTYLYNLHLYDIGNQHIKGNSGGISNGVVACSSIGYTEQGAVGDYNGGVDLHDAHGWQLAHNYIYNIAGDGSGCDVDVLCGNYTSGPAILIWNGSSDVFIYDNTIVNSYRNIALGLGRKHDGGAVVGNRIVQAASGDAGIELYTASNVLVADNIVELGSNYPGAIEYRSSSNILIRGNLVSSSPWDRGGNRAVFLYQNRLLKH